MKPQTYRQAAPPKPNFRDSTKKKSMLVAAREWTLPHAQAVCPAPSAGLKLLPGDTTHQLYACLLSGSTDASVKERSVAFLGQALRQVQGEASDLPATADGLADWMHRSAEQASIRYRVYLETRKGGAPRQYFTNRAHALYFLRAVAPTKLVDGAWLHGLLAHAKNPRFADLITTYVEELGEGQADKNHVLLYRKLIERYGLNPVQGLPVEFYTQGALQLALSLNAEEFLPEVIGFNLGYEQLPLHLLITAHELNELGIDPYYFTLHITVDNADSGHAQRAVQAVLDNMPQFSSRDEFWQRVQRGCALSNAGIGTTEVIGSFDIEREIEAVFSRKRVAGRGAHSDYCRVAGRSINDWLAESGSIAPFLAALEQAGWIKRGTAPTQSRFWKLLQGDKAEMFGVFSPYELQLIHDWIRGDASADGQVYGEPALPAGRSRETFRAHDRMTQHRAAMLDPGQLKVLDALDDEVLDADLQGLRAKLEACSSVDAQQRLLVQAMSPGMHWTPAGMYATRQFMRLAV